MSAKNQVLKNCNNCGKEFSVPASWSFRKFCSQSCFSKFTWNQEEYKKKIREAHLGISPINKGKKGLQVSKFKGTHGLSKGRRKKGYVVSLESRIKSSATHQKISINEWKGFTASGLKHLRKSAKWREWRKSVFERDNYTCQWCEKRGVYLEPHHIKRVCDFPDLIFEKENGLTLCKNCHNITRTKKYKEVN